MKKISSLSLQKGFLITFIFVLFLSTVIKITEVGWYNYPFTMDQGRDLVDIRHMVVTHTPRLVGPTTSINGVLLGPFWYYFNLVPFVFSGGNPTCIAIWQILWFQIAVVFLWYAIKKRSYSLASFVGILLLLSPTGFNTSRYFWNANSMPLFVVFYFASLLTSIEKKTSKNLLVLGLVSGLAMQIEAAFGIILFPFAFVYLLATKTNWKKLVSLVLGFGVTIIPQVLFELRHGYIMTKTLLEEFTGRGNMLGVKISLRERIVDRSENFIDLLRHANHIPEKFVFILFTVALISFFLAWFKNKSKSKDVDLWHLSFYFTLFSAIFYLVFSQKLKIWYTLGLSVPITIFLAGFLNLLYESKSKIIKYLSAVIVFFTILFSIKAQFEFIRDYTLKTSSNPSNLANEIVAVDWVYQNANSTSFKVYSYLPSIYDFPYNYIFWWYGNKKYRYEPSDIAYLPNQPEYIRDTNKIWKNPKTGSTNDPIFLIIESDSEVPLRVQQWLGHFWNLCEVKEVTYPWHTKVKMMRICKNKP